MQRSFNVMPNAGKTSFSKRITGLFLLLIVFVFSSCLKDRIPPKNCFSDDKDKNWTKGDKGPAEVVVFATGFNNPRSVRFGPDCHLYVAEAGLGGTENTDDQCPESVPFDSPYLGSATGGRISKVGPDGVRHTVTDKLPTTKSAFNDIIGPSDIAFIGHSLYVLLYAGCGHGVPSVPNSIAKVNNDGSITVLADLGAWRLENHVANPPTEDFDPEGTFHNMITVGNAFYVLDANHGDFVKVTLDGTIKSLVDVSDKEGHIVPTVLEYAHGDFFIGNLGLFPIVDGSSNIYRVTDDGNMQVVIDDLTSILGLVIDKKGRTYVLETTVGNDFPTPGTGRIVRIDPNGDREVIASGFSNPIGMAQGPDGNLYVCNWGFGGEEGDGEVLKVILRN